MKAEVTQEGQSFANIFIKMGRTMTHCSTSETEGELWTSENKKNSPKYFLCKLDRPHLKLHIPLGPTVAFRSAAQSYVFLKVSDTTFDLHLMHQFANWVGPQVSTPECWASAQCFILSPPSQSFKESFLLVAALNVLVLRNINLFGGFNLVFPC